MQILRAIKNTAAYRLRAFAKYPIRPRKLRLAVTNRCNSRCRTCSVWQLPDSSAEELTLEEYDAIFSRNRAFFSSLRHMSFTGGEPLMRNDLEEIIRIAHRHFPSTTLNINSNGFLTNRLVSIAQSLTASEIRMTYNISLDALDETHDRMRGIPNASQMALASIRGLRSMEWKYVRTNINCMLTKENADACADVYRFCRENRLEFNPIVPVHGELYKNEDLDLALPEESRRKLLRIFDRADPQNGISELVQAVVRDQLLGRPRDYRCWAGSVILLVEENGDIYPNGGCPRDWSLGNVRSHGYDMRQLFGSAQARSVLRKVARCRSCQIPCEALTSLKYPEALRAYAKIRRTRKETAAGR